MRKKLQHNLSTLVVHVSIIDIIVDSYKILYVDEASCPELKLINWRVAVGENHYIILIVS